MLVDITAAALALMGLPFDAMPFILVLGLAVTGGYILFVLPTPIFVAIAQNAEVVGSLWSAALVHLVEKAIARDTGRTAAPAQWRQPRQWLYRSVIAIFDAQRLLSAPPGGPQAAGAPESEVPGWLKREITALSVGDKPYDIIVAELRRPGWRLLVAQVSSQLRYGHP